MNNKQLWKITKVSNKINLQSFVCTVCTDIHYSALDENNTDGFKLCPVHQQIHDNGFIFFVEVHDEDLKGRDIHSINRTGNVLKAHKSVQKNNLAKEVFFCTKEQFKNLQELGSRIDNLKILASMDKSQLH